MASGHPTFTIPAWQSQVLVPWKMSWFTQEDSHGLLQAGWKTETATFSFLTLCPGTGHRWQISCQVTPCHKHASMQVKVSYWRRMYLLIEYTSPLKNPCMWVKHRSAWLLCGIYLLSSKHEGSEPSICSNCGTYTMLFIINVPSAIQALRWLYSPPTVQLQVQDAVL